MKYCFDQEELKDKIKAAVALTSLKLIMSSLLKDKDAKYNPMDEAIKGVEEIFGVKN